MREHIKLSDPLVELIAGLTAGAATTLVSHPLDLVKTRLQVARVRDAPRVGDTLRILLRITQLEGGYQALYRGLTPNLVGNTLSWALYFVCYDQAKKRIALLKGQKELAYKDFFWASGISGAFTAACSNPIWVVKTRMLSTSASTTGAYRSSYDGLREIYRTDGLRGFYRGFVPSLFGVIHGALQFMAYEKLKQYRQQELAPKGRKLSGVDFVVLSASSKLIAGSATYPYQVMRSRLQIYNAEKTYRGTLDVVSQVLRFEGVGGFYKGLVPNLLRILPSTCVTFLVYEMTKQNLKPPGPVDVKN